MQPPGFPSYKVLYKALPPTFFLALLLPSGPYQRYSAAMKSWPEKTPDAAWRAGISTIVGNAKILNKQSKNEKENTAFDISISKDEEKIRALRLRLSASPAPKSLAKGTCMCGVPHSGCSPITAIYCKAGNQAGPWWSSSGQKFLGSSQWNHSILPTWKWLLPMGARHPQGCVLVSRRTIWFCCWFWLQIQAGSALLWALTGCWYAWKSLACAPAGLLAKLHVGSSRLHSAGGAREPTWLLRGQTPVGNKGFSSSCLCWCLLAG